MIFIVAIAILIAFFAGQYALCKKVRQRAVRLIPLCVLGLCAVLTIADFAGLFNTGGSFIAANGIFGLFLGAFTVVGLIGDGLGWLLYRGW